MLVPDAELALDFLDALGQKWGPASWTGQQYQLFDSLLGWLGRSRLNSLHDDLPLQASTALFEHLRSSEGKLVKRMQEVKETDKWAWQTVRERGTVCQALLNPDGTVDFVKRTAGNFAAVIVSYLRVTCLRLLSRYSFFSEPLAVTLA